MVRLINTKANGIWCYFAVIQLDSGLGTPISPEEIFIKLREYPLNLSISLSGGKETN